MKLPFKDKLQLPAVAAPMFLISGPRLVIECCKNGIVGTFPALNQRCVKHKVPLIITSLGAVSDLVNAVHSYGGLVYHDIIKKRHAEKASEAGVDGLILVAAGAGGHAGTLNPLALINEIKQFFDKTLLLSGCISTGKDIASALQMGADLAYMGTRFINVKESLADSKYQEMIINSKAEDIIYTAAVSGVNANFLRPSLESMGITEALWSQTKKIDFGKELDAAKAEAQAWKTIWSAGQGVTAINDTPTVAALVSQLQNEFKEALEAQRKNLDFYF
ncbi:MAG: nitronate monooxygenase [Flavobacteriia bacterium]|nr:nitronate monooxygenase [Flavobacteriia bacterium]